MVKLLIIGGKLATNTILGIRDVVVKTMVERLVYKKNVILL